MMPIVPPLVLKLWKERFTLSLMSRISHRYTAVCCRFPDGSWQAAFDTTQNSEDNPIEVKVYFHEQVEEVAYGMVGELQ